MMVASRDTDDRTTWALTRCRQSFDYTWALLGHKLADDRLIAKSPCVMSCGLAEPNKLKDKRERMNP